MTPLQQLHERTVQRLERYRPFRYRTFSVLMYVGGWLSLGLAPLFALVSRSRALAGYLASVLGDVVTILRAGGHDSAPLWQAEQIAKRLEAQRGHGRYPMLLACLSAVLAVLFIPAAILLAVFGTDGSQLWRWAVLAVALGGSWVLLLFAGYVGLQNTLEVQYRLVRDAVKHLSAVLHATGAAPLTAPPHEGVPAPAWVYLAGLTYLPTLWGVVMVRQSARWSHHVCVVVRKATEELAERVAALQVGPDGEVPAAVSAPPADAQNRCPDPQCRAANIPEARYCQRCGRRLEE
jgi:hypothetical protein